jgi:uncharacterized protein YndB with AHSA1/START domain
MGIFVKILIGLALLALLLAVVGFMLPRQFRIERSMVMAAPAEKIYPLVSEPKNWTRWGVWNQRDPNMTLAFSGPASGVGAKWSWQSKSEGNGAMEFTGAEANRQIVYKLTFADMGMESKGVLSLVAEGTGTRVTWTNEGEFGNNPFVRYFGLMMDTMVGKDFDGGLKNLKVLAEKT